MRTRSRSFPSPNRDIGWTVVRHNSSTGTNTEVAASPSNNEYFNIRSETISDEINLKRDYKAEAKLKRRLALAERLKDPVLRRSVTSDLYTESLQVHRCTHTKQELSFLAEQVLVSQHTFLPHFSYSHSCRNGYQLVRFANCPSSVPGNALSVVSQGTNFSQSDTFHTPDWFALLTKWHEACNSLIPSSTLIGESMIEHAIFIDAFKAIRNPTTILKKFLEVGRDFAKKKTTLGKVAKALRTSSDSFLSYNFGIRPAINEVRNVISAHKKVGSRMAFLRSNVGGYVPIRVRTKIPSDFTSSYVSGQRGLIITDKHVEACISALGKVRPDLDYAKDWMAYVQYFGLHKVFGLAWELIPFSFVLDWVTNAGDYVNKYTTPRFDPPFYNLRNICHSVKQVVAQDYVIPGDFYLSEYQSRLTSTDPITIARLKTSSYSRSPGLPTTSGSVDFSLLGTFHALASGSLLIQKILK